jgi:predicted nucleic acid-binding protein
MHGNSEAPRLVLDTNVVLDWLLFRDPSCTPLAAALASGHATWITTAAMLNELAHVLGRGTLAAWQPDSASIDASCRRWARQVEPDAYPAPGSPALRLRCSDPDDQKFIDLALQLGRDACLLSRDRALLRLARRARDAGVAILRPQDWPPAR